MEKSVDIRSARYCSNNIQHRVLGYKNSLWYCSECCMQWVMNVYSGNIQSYQYQGDGTKELVEEVSIESYLAKKSK